jgi:hypothetical protein
MIQSTKTRDSFDNVLSMEEFVKALKQSVKSPLPQQYYDEDAEDDKKYDDPKPGQNSLIFHSFQFENHQENKRWSWVPISFLGRNFCTCKNPKNNTS